MNMYRVAECLYRNESGTYFAIMKVTGKKVRKSLNTFDRETARQRLGAVKGCCVTYSQYKEILKVV